MTANEFPGLDNGAYRSCFFSQRFGSARSGERLKIFVGPISTRQAELLGQRYLTSTQTSLAHGSSVRNQTTTCRHPYPVIAETMSTSRTFATSLSRFCRQSQRIQSQSRSAIASARWQTTPRSRVAANIPSIRTFTSTAPRRHGHLTPPKPGEE